MDDSLVKVLVPHDRRDHLNVLYLIGDVLDNLISPRKRLKQIHPLLHLAHLGEVVWKMLVDAILAQQDRCPIVEDIPCHFVHVADNFEHKVFVRPQKLNLEDLNVLSESLAVFFVVPNH